MSACPNISFASLPKSPRAFASSRLDFAFAFDFDLEFASDQIDPATYRFLTIDSTSYSTSALLDPTCPPSSSTRSLLEAKGPGRKRELCGIGKATLEITRTQGDMLHIPYRKYEHASMGSEESLVTDLRRPHGRGDSEPTHHVSSCVSQSS